MDGRGDLGGDMLAAEDDGGGRVAEAWAESGVVAIASCLRGTCVTERLLSTAWQAGAMVVVLGCVPGSPQQPTFRAP